MPLGGDKWLMLLRLKKQEVLTRAHQNLFVILSEVKVVIFSS